MKLKPLPKLILIVAVVGAVGFGLSRVDFASLKKEEPAVATVPTPPVTTVSPDTAPAPTALQNANSAVQAAKEAAAAAPAPVAPPVGLTPAPTNDAGLANVLGTTKK